MKTRFALSTLFSLAALASLFLAAIPAHANDDYERCGTRYPGWWRRKLGPRGILDRIIIIGNEISGPREIIGTRNVAYDVKFFLKNRLDNTPADRITPPDLPVLVSMAATDSSGYPNPDDPFDPNDPGNPYTISAFTEVMRGKIPSLKPGEIYTLRGTFTMPRGQFLRLFNIAMGFDTYRWLDPEGCGNVIPPFPIPWPNPWWWKLIQSTALNGRLTMSLVSVSGPTPYPWIPGYESVRIVLGIKNNSLSSFGQMRFRAVHNVIAPGGMPNPDDPFDPNSPWGPYANVFREKLKVSIGGQTTELLPYLRAGDTAFLEMEVRYPTDPGYLNTLFVQVF